MRTHFWMSNFLVLICGVCGCTNTQLRVSATRQAKTLTDTQYEQVLNNLAMFCLDPYALPSLVVIKNGSTQIGDTGTLGFLGNAGLMSAFGSSPTIAGSRSIVDQWGTAPVTDDNVLKVVRMAYQNAIGNPKWLSEDDANDMGHDLSQQVGTNADISTDLEMLKTVASITRPLLSETGAKRTTPQTVAGTVVGEGGQITVDGKASMTAVQDLRGFAEVSIELDKEITNTLDADFLKYEDASEPYSKFVLVGSDDDPDFFRPGIKKQIEEIEKELSCVDPASEIREKKKAGAIPRQSPDDKAKQTPPKPPEGVHEKATERAPILPGGTQEERRKALSCKLSKIAPNLEIAPKTPTPSTGLAKETQRRINEIQDELEKIATKLPPGWFRVGCKKDVPKHACYVGCHKSCGRECWVWVDQDGLEALAEFTLSVLKLSTTFKETQIVTVPSGIQFSPALSGRAGL